MNTNQQAFSKFWGKVSNTIFYKVVKITENTGFTDIIFDRQREELSSCIKNEINRTFFDHELRPESTVWFENLKKSYPKEAALFENYVKNCKITSKCYENIITIAAGGAATLTGAAIRRQNPLVSGILVLAGIAASGFKIASALSIDTQVLQQEVKKQFDLWEKSLSNLLQTCDEYDEYIDPAQNEDE